MATSILEGKRLPNKVVRDILDEALSQEHNLTYRLRLYESKLEPAEREVLNREHVKRYLSGRIEYEGNWFAAVQILRMILGEDISHEEYRRYFRETEYETVVDA